MLLDANLELVKGSILSMTNTPVCLKSLLIPGKTLDPIPLLFSLPVAVTGATAISVKLQQCDTETGTYTDVPNGSASFTNLAVGVKHVLKYLPRDTTKHWVKLVVTVTGTATAGEIYAAIVREIPDGYEAGQFINKGLVEA